MAGIELQGIAKHYGAVTGVQRLDLAIADREFVVLLGPSGCGKTTTMRMIAGLEQPSEGRVLIGGQDMTGVDARDRDVAMVFQGYALYPNMTVAENIRFPLRMRGIPRAEHDARVRRAAEMVELGHLLDRKPAALSGGQRQRAALARQVLQTGPQFLEAAFAGGFAVKGVRLGPQGFKSRPQFGQARAGGKQKLAQIAA